MKNGFDAAYKRVRVYEGGNVDDPKDPGGRTSRGVTQRVYDAWRRRNGKPPRDVWKAAEADVKTIYREQYWNAVRGEELPAGVDVVVYDGGVNSGPKQSIKWLQAALNARRGRGSNLPVLDVDGVLGEVTLDRVAAETDNDLLIAEIGALRMGFLKRLKSWKRFGKGWSARVANLIAAGQALATGSVGPAPVSVEDDGGHMKAEPDDVQTSPVTPPAATSLAGGGIALETANEKVSELAGQVQAVADVSQILRYVFVGLTIVGVALTVYAFWRNSRADKATAAIARAPVPQE